MYKMIAINLVKLYKNFSVFLALEMLDPEGFGVLLCIVTYCIIRSEISYGQENTDLPDEHFDGLYLRH